jgi:hypothetical protein
MEYSIGGVGRFYTKLRGNRIGIGQKILKRLEKMDIDKIDLNLSSSDISDKHCKYLSGDLFRREDCCPETAKSICDGRLYVRSDLRYGMMIEDGSEVVVIGKPMKNNKAQLEIFRKQDYDLIINDYKRFFSCPD